MQRHEQEDYVRFSNNSFFHVIFYIKYLHFSVSLPVITLRIYFLLFSPINSNNIIEAHAGFPYLYSDI